jgi:hypothetical protein
LVGLASLHYDLHPNIIFLQEVSLNQAALTAVAATMGLQVWYSAAGPRTMAVLSALPLTVTVVEAGRVKQVLYQSLGFLHFHLPAGNGGMAERNALLRRLHPELTANTVPPS